MQIEWVLTKIESGPVSASDLKRNFHAQFPDVDEPAYRNMMSSIVYCELVENAGLKRLSVYALTDLGHVHLAALRKSHNGV